MPKSFAYADLIPENPHAPFANPTEEPDYSPDYCQIAPELETPQSHLPLFPSRDERTRIRRYYDLTLLTLLFAFFSAMTLTVGLELLASVIMHQIDLRALGELPQNYSSITALYFSDSSISGAIRLIAFLCGNLTAFLIGCKLTGIRTQEFFRTRALTAPLLLSYLFFGIWMQMLGGHLGTWISAAAKHAGISLSSSAYSISGSLHRTAAIALYFCLIAPVTEELLLRGLVLKNCCRVSQRHGILLSAVLFAVMQENLLQGIVALPLGILLAYITIRHNSVAPAIAVRICVNTAEFLTALSAAYLSSSAQSTLNLIYTLTLLLIGTVIFFLHVMTERMPVPTPHQSMRGWRIILGAPLFWVFLLVHIFHALLQNGIIRLPI